MNKRKLDLTCIVCPIGCQIKVEIEDNKVTNLVGYGCPRGKEWGIEEATSPKRVVMSVIKVKKGDIPTVSVKTDRRMPKERIRDVMRMLARLEVEAPVHIGAIIVKDILGLGVNIIATREVREKVSISDVKHSN